MSQENSNENLYDVYVSYHIDQKSQVENICNLFKDSGLRLWINNDSLKNFDQDLHALQQSCIFVCFLSKQYQKSIQNRIEYSIATEQRMRQFNFCLEESIWEVKENKNTTYVDISKMSLIDLSFVVKAIKNEANFISKTFKQSSKHAIESWYAEEFN